MKYNLRRQEEEGEEEGDSDCEIQQLKQKIRLRRQQIRRSRLPPCATSQHSKATLTAVEWKEVPCVEAWCVFPSQRGQNMKQKEG